MVEEDLVVHMQNGEDDSFSQIYELYRNRLYYYAINKVGNSQDAEDIVQTTFIDTYKSVRNLKDAKAFKAFIYTILRRNCYKFYAKDEKNKPEVEYIDENFDLPEDEETDASPDYSLVTNETKDTVMQLIDALPDEQKECVLLYYFEEMGTREIAEALEISEGTVKSRLNYARKKIKNEIEESRRKGKSLISLFPLPLLVHLLREFADKNKLSVQASENIASNIGKACSIKIQPTVGGATTGAGTQAAATAAKAGMSAITKVLIGLTAAGVIIGSVAAILAVNNGKPNTPVVSGMQDIIEPSLENDLPQTENIVLEDINLPKLPESFSDYAKIYYDYIQTDLKNRDDIEFIDAEMADMDKDGKPELIVCLKGIDPEDSGAYIYTLQLTDENDKGYTIYMYKNIVYLGGFYPRSDDAENRIMPNDDGSLAIIAHDSAVCFLYNDNGRVLLCAYSKIVNRPVGPINNEYRYYNHLSIDVIDPSLANPYYNYSMPSSYDSRYGRSYVNGISDDIGYDEAKRSLDRFMNVSRQYGTWGYAYVGDGEGFNFVNTGGERLRDYFED